MRIFLHVNCNYLYSTWFVSNILKPVDSQVKFPIKLVFWRKSSRSFCTYDFPVAILVQLFSNIVRKKLRNFLHFNCGSLDFTCFISNTVNLVESHVIFRFSWFFNESPAEVFVPMIFQLLYWLNCFQNLLGSNWDFSCMSIVTTCILLDSFLKFWNQLILKLISQLSWFFDVNPAEVFVLMIFQLLYWSNCFQILFGSNWETSCISIVDHWTLLDSSLPLWI